MTEWLLFIDMLLQFGEAAGKIKTIMESEGREPTAEEWAAALGRMDAATSGWKEELERRRAEAN